MKVLLFSDLHIGIGENKPVWEDLPNNFCLEICDRIIKENIKHVLFLGDLFDAWKEISTKSINTAISFMEKVRETGAEIHLVLGNHDIYYKNQNSVNSIRIFDEWEGVHVYYEQEKRPLPGFCIVPWGQSIPQKREDDKYLLGHFDIQGFYLSNKYKNTKNGWSIEHFREWDRVFSGHYHIPQKDKNIQYLGAPYFHNFGDLDKKRGYWILDTSKDDLQFYEWKDSPHFYQFWNDDIDFNCIHGNMIRIHFNEMMSENNIDQILANIKAKDPLELHTDFSGMTSVDNENVEESKEMDWMTEQEIFLSYLDQVNIPDHLNLDFCKKTLKSLF